MFLCSLSFVELKGSSSNFVEGVLRVKNMWHCTLLGSGQGVLTCDPNVSLKLLVHFPT